LVVVFVKKGPILRILLLKTPKVSQARELIKFRSLLIFLLGRVDHVFKLGNE